jgi:hypothetical protein
VSDSLEEEGVQFPRLEEAPPRARLAGLFGDVRMRAADLCAEADGLAPNLEDLADLRESLTLGRKGVASREGGKFGAFVLRLCEGDGAKGCEAIRLMDGEAGDAEPGDALELFDASELCDICDVVRFRLNFEGDRESDRRSDRTVACTSMCDG